MSYFKMERLELAAVLLRKLQNNRVKTQERRKG